jgi:superfamily II DNA or RNA helicase
LCKTVELMDRLQLQAAYILPAIHKRLKAYADTIENGDSKLEGLLDWLSTYDVETSLNLQPEETSNSICAVARNLLTRGRPTIPSIELEKYWAEELGLTEEKRGKYNGQINFVLKDDVILEGEQLWKALHPIAQPIGDVGDWYNTEVLGSSFELSFLNSYLADQPVYAQLLMPQRSRASVGQGYTRGDLDFSLETPYYLPVEQQNRFNVDLTNRSRQLFVAEVDGAKYHTQQIDHLRDLAVNEMRNVTHRVREASVSNDVEYFLKATGSNPFLVLSRQNLTDKEFLTRTATRAVLEPLAVARVQRAVLDYLLAGHVTEGVLRIAVLERDIECGLAAISDLSTTLNDLSQLASETDFPVVLDCTVCTAEKTKTLAYGDYDLVLDVSVLRRSLIFAEDRVAALHDNVIQIRNAHYVAEETITTVVSASPICYRSVATEIRNEVYEDVPETVGLAEKFLRNIFRKVSFRVGQTPILNRALQQKSVIGLLPTGGGKSLTYQFAALLQPGITIVVDPIRSLMTDQNRGLQENYIHQTGLINSTLKTPERLYVQEMLRQGQLQFIFVSPERFVIKEFRNALGEGRDNGVATAYIVIDEAHCVSEWGHDFRIPYLNLGKNGQRFCMGFDRDVPPPIFGLTATASFDVLSDIERELQIAEDDGKAVIRFENTVRDEVNYRIEETPSGPVTGMPPWSYKNAVGKPKQNRVFEILAEKENLFAPYDDYATVIKVAAWSFDNYLGDAGKEEWLALENGEITAAKSRYVNETAKRVHFYESKGECPFLEKMEDRFGYGTIIFAPHRTAVFGVQGIFKHDKHTISDGGEDGIINYRAEESGDRLGYFMGSSDATTISEAEQIDKEAFAHMDRFTAGEISVMVATKAFGMGIDKPDIRLTVHLNLPASIESFVQEAGRAGRDRKGALSVVLFNDENFFEDPEGNPCSVDANILHHFHKLSFKGQMKERSMLYELRNKVSFPAIKRLKLLGLRMQQHPDLSDIKIEVWQGTVALFLDFKNAAGDAVFRLNLNSLKITTNAFGLTKEMLSPLKQLLDKMAKEEPASKEEWLKDFDTADFDTRGIEVQCGEMNYGDQGSLMVHFTNNYAHDANAHHELVFRKMIAAMTAAGARVDAETEGLRNTVVSSVRKTSTYDKFVKELGWSEGWQNFLSRKDLSVIKQLQAAYYAPRTNQDTGKAIYRLSSIGIIDDYTIDYQNSLYELHFTKKTDEDYFEGLRQLIARYSSEQKSIRLIEELKLTAVPRIEEGKATAISSCLEFLTTYIYDNIRRKRRRAIDDMIQLCRQAVKIEDPFEQNILVKDEVFYYFNAKYSRPGYTELVKDEAYGASMPDDHQAAVPVRIYIDKYLDLVEAAETGEFINNVKHLRGSTMRMLRSYPENPEYMILKSFALFVLGSRLPELRKEGVAELTEGLYKWRVNDVTFDAISFMAAFEERLSRHIRQYYNLTEKLEESLLNFEVRYYSEWLTKFNDRILKPENDEQHNGGLGHFTQTTGPAASRS